MSRNPPPPQQNNNSGRNEYIPQYISAKPFYAEDLLKNEEYLSHQRSKAEQKDTIDKAKWYERGRKSGPAATKYRKGACENCGAMTHKTKECLSRPRKHGAKWTGKDIHADEVVDDVSLGWDAKRDRWNGYDVREYDSVIKEYEDMETLRKAAAANGKASVEMEGDPRDGDLDGEGNDGDHYAEETDMGRNQPTSTRQLRLREDTAKYLVNLDLDSAKYDPKTRSMDTTAQTLNNSDTTSMDLASEGFTRPSHDPKSDAAAFEKAQRYAWENQENPSGSSTTPSQQQQQQQTQGNSKVHLEANPTASALAHKQHQAALAAKKDQQKAYLLSKYGDPSATASNKPKVQPTSITSSSAFTTYDPETGAAIDAATGKPFLKPVAKSKYPEDIYPGNHTSVFGSWWRDGKWGYRCCHSFVRNSYCTGEEGIRGFEDEEAQRLGRNLVSGLEGERDSDLLRNNTADGEAKPEAVEVDMRRKRTLEDEDATHDDRGKRHRTEEPS